jgi:hypothetical protein
VRYYIHLLFFGLALIFSNAIVDKSLGRPDISDVGSYVADWAICLLILFALTWFWPKLVRFTGWDPILSIIPEISDDAIQYINAELAVVRDRLGKPQDANNCLDADLHRQITDIKNSLAQGDRNELDDILSCLGVNPTVVDSVRGTDAKPLVSDLFNSMVGACTTLAERRVRALSDQYTVRLNQIRRLLAGPPDIDEADPPDPRLSREWDNRFDARTSDEHASFVDDLIKTEIDAAGVQLQLTKLFAQAIVNLSGILSLYVRMFDEQMSPDEFKRRVCHYGGRIRAPPDSAEVVELICEFYGTWTDAVKPLLLAPFERLTAARH